MVRGRLPLDVWLAAATCVFTPHIARAARGRLAIAARELRDVLFSNGRERWRDWPRIPRPKPSSGAFPLPAAGSGMNVRP